MKKKIISVLLAGLVMAAIPVQAFAEQDRPVVKTENAVETAEENPEETVEPVVSDGNVLSMDNTIKITEPVTLSGEGLVEITDASNWYFESLDGYSLFTLHTDGKQEWSVARKQGWQPVPFWENGVYKLKGTCKLSKIS